PMGTVAAGSGATPSSLIIAKMLDLNATIPGPVTPDGGVLTSSIEEHPAYGQLNRSGYIKQTRSNVIATFGMEQDLGMLVDGLSIKAVMSFDSRSNNNFYASRNYERYVQVIDPNLVGQDGQDSV